MLDPPVRIRVRTLLILVALITAYSARDVQSTPGYRDCPQIFSGEEPPTVPVEPSLVGELVVKVEWFDLLFGSRGHP